MIFLKAKESALRLTSKSSQLYFYKFLIKQKNLIYSESPAEVAFAKYT